MKLTRALGEVRRKGPGDELFIGKLMFLQNFARFIDEPEGKKGRFSPGVKGKFTKSDDVTPMIAKKLKP